MTNQAPPLTVVCTRCKHTMAPPDAWQRSQWVCVACGLAVAGKAGFIDLGPDACTGTAEHYSLQWGEELGFLDFLRGNRAAKAVMPAGQLGWDELFDEIRRRGAAGPVYLYDAACGYGGIASDLLDDGRAPGLVYLGADIHGALPLIAERIPRLQAQGLLVRWDIAAPPPVRESFDYVICRASLHHTPDPPKAFATLCGALKPGGQIAVSVYRRKGACREAADDALRKAVTSLGRDEAFTASRQFTVLGQALQRLTEEVEIPDDLPLLGIRKGRVGVHALVYNHLVKCFYNPIFGDRYSTLVNYDWYHPPYAYRYDLDEVRSWFAVCGLKVVDERSIDAQHYVAGVKPAA